MRIFLLGLGFLLCCQVVLAQEEREDPCGRETGISLRISSGMVLNSILEFRYSEWRPFVLTRDLPGYLLRGSRDGVWYKQIELSDRFGPSQDYEAQLLAYSDLAEEFGAPRMERIIAGEDLNGATRQVLSLPFEVRKELADVYYRCINLAPTREGRINLAKFGHQAFGTMAQFANFQSSLRSLLRTGKSMGYESVKPSLVIVSPAPDSVVGPQPTIRFQLYAGDYRKKQVSLRALSIRVDGKQRANRALIHTEIDESLEEGVTFEVLTLSLSPKLAPGVHTVEVRAQTGESLSTPENTITERWSFTVSD